MNNSSRKYFTNYFELKDGEILIDLEWSPWYISNYGRIKSKKLNTEVKGSVNNCGYRFVGFKKQSKFIHRLVIEAFMGKIPSGMQVNHKDGNKLNNHLNNLEIVTPSQNQQHAIKNGLKIMPTGEDVSTSKITEKQARELIQDLINGETNDYLANKYQLHSRYISLMRHKKRWKKLWEQYPDYVPTKSSGNDNSKKLSKEEFIEIVKKFEAGVSNAEITKEYKMASGNASRIRHKKLYKNYWEEFFPEI